MRTYCCGHIVADTSVSPFARAGNICCIHKFCVRDTKNVSDFVQKHFVTATNVSQFAQPKKHHEQQCARNNVSLFARAFKIFKLHGKCEHKNKFNTFLKPNCRNSAGSSPLVESKYSFNSFSAQTDTNTVIKPIKCMGNHVFVTVKII